MMCAAAAAAAAASARAAAAWVIAAPFAPAPAVHDTFRVRQLVAQAAFEAAAEAGKLGRVQAQVLLLGHLDRHRFERGEKRRAAQWTAAAAVAADHLGRVANADLPHLDPGSELGTELLDQLAEIHPAVGSEVKNDLRAVKRQL